MIMRIGIRSSAVDLDQQSLEILSTSQDILLCSAGHYSFGQDGILAWF
jgi:hypothetical protein